MCEKCDNGAQYLNARMTRLGVSDEEFEGPRQLIEAIKKACGDLTHTEDVLLTLMCSLYDRTLQGQAVLARSLIELKAGKANAQPVDLTEEQAKDILRIILGGRDPEPSTDGPPN